MELQFENVKLGLESRPRNGSHKFTATLGALFLRDNITEDSAFPVLISPQSRFKFTFYGWSVFIVY